MAARVILAQMLWLQGFPDQATDAARSSVEEARATGHAISLCDALAQAACPIAMFIGDLPAAERAVAMLIDQSSVHELGPWNVLGRSWKGALLIKSGKFDIGLPLLRSAIEELREVRFAFYHTGLLGALAEGLASAGDVERGLSVIDDALARCEQKAERWYIAELLRVKGEILMQHKSPDLARAEEHFLQSLDWARRQEALSWELRAATSLARLRRFQGRAAEGRTCLTTVHDRFSEGFATTDLRTAKALVAELS
jgi:predicted ATPase